MLQVLEIHVSPVCEHDIVVILKKLPVTMLILVCYGGFGRRVYPSEEAYTSL